MSFEMKRYVRKPEPIMAVQLTKENYIEVAAWCGAKILESNSGKTIILVVPVAYGEMPITTGEYIYKNAVGAFHVFKEHYFNENYIEDPAFNEPA